MSTSPRASILDLPAYRGGRRPSDVRSGHPPEALARLASNESPFAPLDCVRAVIADEIDSVNRYPEVRSDTLRDELARWLDVAPASVATGPGSSGLLWQIAEAVLEPGDEMVVPDPSFEAYPIIARLMGAELVEVPVRDHVVDVDAMLGAITESTKLMVVAEPNNPTGTAVGPDGLERLIDGTVDRCLVVVDEAYFEFAPAADAHRSIEMARQHTHVLVLRTFSKAHGLAGLRVGYALGDPPLIELLDRVAPPFSVSSLGQAAALASLRAVDELHERVAVVTAERERVLSALRDAGLDVPPTATNFVWVPCGDDAERWSASLDADGIITRPIAGRGVRITVGDADDNDRVVAALARLAGNREDQP
jgi:histidinol-phosphate aminotransferase